MEESSSQDIQNQPAEPLDEATESSIAPLLDDAVVVEDAQDAGNEADSQQTEMSQEEASATVEAILFATDAPLTAARISQVAKLPTQRAVKETIKLLNAKYEQANCAFRIEGIAGGYQMLTLPEYHDVLARLFRVRGETKLSPASMETLAMVAYRQPILRADIEAIRGVASGEMLRSLMERQLVKIVGRAEVLGRPMLYGTTKRFLEVFGLGSLEDLPRVEELRAGAKATPVAATPTTVSAPTTESTPTSESAPTTEAPPAQESTPEPPTEASAATTEPAAPVASEDSTSADQTQNTGASAEQVSDNET